MVLEVVERSWKGILNGRSRGRRRGLGVEVTRSLKATQRALRLTAATNLERLAMAWRRRADGQRSTPRSEVEASASSGASRADA